MTTARTAVTIDATVLATAGGYRGIGSYVRNLLGALARDDTLELRAVTTAGTELPVGVRRVRTWRRAPGRWRTAEHDLLLPIDLRRAGGGVIHSPSTEPPPRWSAPLVQTLFDVIPLVFDDPGLAEERQRWRALAARYRRADAIVAISRHAADEGVRVLGLDARRVVVAPLAPGPEFGPSTGPADATDGPPYLLLVGEYSRRKGYDEAFAVIAGLADLGYPHRLRVAGRISREVAAGLDRVLQGAARRDRIELLGFVDDLPSLYRGAAAVVVASRYEGFGLPAVEAMACGAPVVAFANSATTEVVEGAGLLVPDGDVAAMVVAVRRVLDEPNLRDELVGAGLQRAASLTWRATAGIHAEVYRNTAR